MWVQAGGGRRMAKAGWWGVSVSAGASGGRRACHEMQQSKKTRATV